MGPQRTLMLTRAKSTACNFTGMVAVSMAGSAYQCQRAAERILDSQVISLMREVQSCVCAL